jgi:hypothetical protein
MKFKVFFMILLIFLAKANNYNIINRIIKVLFMH